jgi:stage III sporulation protein SpoIIIAA
MGNYIQTLERDIEVMQKEFECLSTRCEFLNEKNHILFYRMCKYRIFYFFSDKKQTITTCHGSRVGVRQDIFRKYKFLKKLSNFMIVRERLGLPHPGNQTVLVEVILRKQPCISITCNQKLIKTYKFSSAKYAVDALLNYLRKYS